MPYNNYYGGYWQQPQQTMLWVASEDEAKMYPVAPNNAVQLWDTNGKSVYIKQADASGKPSMKIYDLTERAEVQQMIPKHSYVKQSEIDAISASVAEIKEELDAMRSDLYGIAGKKKSKLMQEEDE